ncbi:peptide ABC transporter substrate-binding protein [Natranaerobius trueperi]|uniref:Peptide ABC transporter substrate-binding protein n=1 Tax=Natranaerobius trueperi TaxID=759412 RepID=A0A226BXM2_9FIRM|nr:peptide ABC transporter substrate-binding protein [Natranaerobius trueperi]OWZ83685.1 peptide ABC transporter substrate-binding protein [Natranaerobius trueperi]
MKKKFLISILSLMILVSLTLSACDNDEKTSTNGEVEQELSLSLAGEPESLDPAIGSDNNSAQVIERVMEPLTRLDVKDDETVIVPGAAKSWDVCEEGLEWTFHLRDTKWSDGEPLLAKHFEYGIKRILDPKTASPMSSFLYDIKNASEIASGELNVQKAGVEAIDDHTLKIKLENPVPHFLHLTSGSTMTPQRKDIIEKYGSSYGTESDKLVFTGPFKVDEWVHNNNITLVKNENYWDKDSVKLETVNMKIINEESALMGELKNGNVDVATVESAEWIEELDKHDDLKSSTQYLPRTGYIFMNQEIELLSNPKIRQAFSVAIDREEIQDNFHQNVNRAAYGWLAPPIELDGKSFREQVSIDPITELLQENPDAKALFEEGLEELGKEKEPSEITLEIMLPSDRQDFAEYLQQVFSKELGINVVLDSTEWPVFQERNRELDYEMGFKGAHAPYNDPNSLLEIWKTDADIIPTGWSCSEFDELVDKAALSLCEDERFENFKQAERILVKEESVIIPYVYYTENTYKQKYVKGITQPDFGMMGIRNAYIDK